MALKTQVEHKILQEVLKHKEPTKHRTTEWRVLVVDHLAMRMVSACFKMHDILSEGITLVEDIAKKRKPLPSMEAVYFISPSEQSIQLLMDDFESCRSMYRCAHVIFTEACRDVLFDKLCHARVAKFIRTLKEINVAFFPIEQQAFSLDDPDMFRCFYEPSLPAECTVSMERMAEQIATVCVTLGEYPAVRYCSDWGKNAELAQLVQQKLDAYKADEPTMGDAPEKAQSQLLILDRGFDCISPLLHELTYQAMVYDLLPIENDVYCYEALAGADAKKEVLLDESDNLWVELRHQHIAVVSQSITKQLKEFTDSQRMTQAEKQSVGNLSAMIKQLPHCQKQLSKFSTHLHLAEDCMNTYHGYVDRLYKVEQDLAIGTDTEGEKIKDHMRNVGPILSDPQITNKYDKMRIIALYALARNGITEENLSKLMNHAEISDTKKIMNLQYLGANVISDRNNSRVQYTVPRKNRMAEGSYMSRWTPIMKDIIEDCIEDKLDHDHFPFLAGKAQTSSYNVPTSARYGNWYKEKGQMAKNVPRLIVFVVGGMCFSEMRSAYEVTKAVKNWEVIIGSSHVLTPERFLSDLTTIRG